MNEANTFESFFFIQILKQEKKVDRFYLKANLQTNDKMNANICSGQETTGKDN